MYSETLVNGTETRNHFYNSPGWLLRIDGDRFTEDITHTTGWSGAAGYYDGRIKTTSFTYNWAGKPADYAVQYTYDDLGQLTIADNNLNNAWDIGVGNSISYDANGNILDLTRGSTTKTYAYYTGTNKVQNTDGAGNDYIYDSNANVTSSSPKSINTIAYDSFTQRPTSVTLSSGSSLTLKYGGDTQRVLKNYTSGGSTNSKLYLHGQNDYPLIEKNRVNVTAETLAVYIYGLNGVVAKRVGSTVLFLVKDHLGSTRVAMDATGLVRTYYDYDALGNIIRIGTTNEVKYQFTGQEYDESVLHNYRARLYDSDLGKFYAVDPAGQGWSPYAYAGNNPVILVDPDGEWFFSAFLGPVGAVIDAALWSATIDAATQGVKIAFGAQKGFDFAELGGAFASGAIGAGLGLAAPSFSGSSLGVKYAGKAAYAGFTGAVSATGGLFTQDLLENGKIDYSGKDYLNTAKWGGGIAAGVSLGYSAYDYITWDRFSPQQRLDIINREFHSNIQYDPNLTGSYASTNIRTLNVRFGDAALENKAIARNTALHELRHVGDIQAIRAGTLQISGNPRLFLEARGHLADIKAASLHNLPSRYLFESVRGLRSYGYAGSIPKALRWKNIWFNLLR